MAADQALSVSFGRWKTVIHRKLALKQALIAKQQLCSDSEPPR